MPFVVQELFCVPVKRGEVIAMQSVPLEHGWILLSGTWVCWLGLFVVRDVCDLGS